ncbi:uncharacterized protein LOC110265407, partial [Arachis ipaensis]|uniref:uncharacterized protein LOC110265407 n=1 Tax=Arachis ipaensis TaxID=130454 RepID=UPI000A2B2AB0
FQQILISLYSFLSSSDAGGDNAKVHGQSDGKGASGDGNNSLLDSWLKENNVGKKSLFSRSKQSLGRVICQAARIGGFRHQGRKDNNSEMNSDCLNGSGLNGVEMNHLATVKRKESESLSLVDMLKRILLLFMDVTVEKEKDEADGW